MKVSWSEHKTNEEVLQMVDTEREMMDTKDNVRRMNTTENRLWKTKNNVLRTMFLDWLLKME